MDLGRLDIIEEADPNVFPHVAARIAVLAYRHVENSGVKISSNTRTRVGALEAWIDGDITERELGETLSNGAFQPSSSDSDENAELLGLINNVRYCRDGAYETLEEAIEAGIDEDPDYFTKRFAVAEICFGARKLGVSEAELGDVIADGVELALP